MKLVIIEPLGVEKEKLLALAEEKLEGKVEIVYYDTPVSYTHLRAHETRHDLVCRLLLEKKKNKESEK